MKFSELKQAMDWRRRVGFNGGGYVRAKFANGKRVLPKKKPEEEVRMKKSGGGVAYMLGE